MSISRVTELFKDNEKIGKILIDEASQNITYIGRSHDPDAQNSDASWQIIRVLNPGSSSVIRIEFANSGSFNNVWNDRATLFSPPGPLSPITGLNGITPEEYRAFSITYTSFNEVHTITYYADSAKTISLGTLTYEYDLSNNLIGGVFN